MPLWPETFAGRIDEHTIDSDLLRDNPLGDPHRRPLWVYTPPGYDSEPARRYPVVYMLLGFTGTLAAWSNEPAAYRSSVPVATDRLFARGDAPPMILVLVNAWTAYGGSQYIDSTGTGPYHSYLCEEIVPWIDARYRTLATRDHRAIAGKSSGGLGAMVTSMLRPDLFGAFATHSGDALSEAQYIPHFLWAARHRHCILHTTGWSIFYQAPLGRMTGVSRKVRTTQVPHGSQSGARAIGVTPLVNDQGDRC